VTLKRAPERRGAIAALGFGALWSAIPVCATLPDDRNFIIASFGFFGILGMAIESVWRRATGDTGALTRWCMGVLVVVHLAIAPLLFPARSLNMALTLGGFVERGAKTFPSGDRVTNKVFVIVGVPDQLMLTFMMLERLVDPGPKARTSTTLTVQGAGPYTVKYVDQDTVEIRNPIGELHSPFTAMYTTKPFYAGQVFDRALDRVEILATTSAGEPSAVRATIRVPVDDRIWLVWRDSGLVEIPAPLPGEQLTFQGIDLFSAMQK
jgi:hypothetical protein